MNFSRKILDWYDLNKRDFPWRLTDNPYVIWLAEVIFQQTRIDQGMAYFHRFIERFPTVQDLANANQEEVLKLWQGLGYYSRGRNVHFSAQYIVNELGGQFPNSYKEWLKIKGVGPYIAAEVASVCFGEPIAAVDGNVQRVIARFFGVLSPVNETIGSREISALANEYLDKIRPGDFNQALMDFGSLMCKPKSPLCLQCPLSEGCWAFRNGQQDVLPVKRKKIKVRHRYFHYVVHLKNQKLAMNKRGAGDVWEGLFQPLLVEAKTLNDEVSEFGIEGYLLSESTRQLSHQKLFLKFWVSDRYPETLFDSIEWVSVNDISSLPVPKSIEQLFCSHEFEQLLQSHR